VSSPSRPNAKHRDRRDEEHGDEREEPEQRPADSIEDGGAVDEEVLQERDENSPTCPGTPEDTEPT